MKVDLVIPGDVNFFAFTSSIRMEMSRVSLFPYFLYRESLFLNRVGSSRSVENTFDHFSSRVMQSTTKHLFLFILGAVNSPHTSSRLYLENNKEFNMKKYHEHGTYKAADCENEST